MIHSKQELKSTAEMTAALHRHASKWQPPSSFIRPTVNRARIRNALDLIKQQVQEGFLDAHDVQIGKAFYLLVYHFGNDEPFYK